MWDKCLPIMPKGLFIVVLIFDVLLNALSEQDLRALEGKIVGGNPVPLEMFPSSVQITYPGAMCAGSILNGWVVVTAAHCFDTMKDTSLTVIQVGARYIIDVTSKQYNVAHSVIHPDYNMTIQFGCDIALVFVTRRIEFSKITKKAIMVGSNEWMNPKESNFTVNGWGRTKYGGEISDMGLMMTYLRFVPIEQCRRWHHSMLSSDMFCLYGEGARDSCNGDSGGGVFWKGFLVGIVSHGDGCAKKYKPSVYTNVRYFRNWIKNEISKYFSDNCLYLSSYDLIRT